MHACDDQRFDAVPDAVLVLALLTYKSETSQSQRRTRNGRFACFSIRNDREPYLPSKIHYVYKNNGKLVRLFLWQEQRWAHMSTDMGGPRAMKAPLREVKCQTRSLRSRFFFFFACGHHVGLAYISSDLRTCTQRLFTRNISDNMYIDQCGPCEYVITHNILGASPVILWISLCGKTKWLPLKFGYHDVMRTSPIAP